MQKDPLIYIGHILDCILKIKKFTLNISEGEFLKNDLIQDAVIRNLEILGEATKNISPEIRSNHPEIPWKKMSGLRDKLIHDYVGVDLNSVWNVITDAIPDLEENLKTS